MPAFYFTFGSGHINGDGTPLGNRYYPVEAPTWEDGRQLMWHARGSRWSFQYESADKAGVAKWQLAPIDLNDLSLQPS